MRFHAPPAIQNHTTSAIGSASRVSHSPATASAIAPTTARTRISVAATANKVHKRLRDAYDFVLAPSRCTSDTNQA